MAVKLRRVFSHFESSLFSTKNCLNGCHSQELCARCSLASDRDKALINHIVSLVSDDLMKVLQDDGVDKKGADVLKEFEESKPEVIPMKNYLVRLVVYTQIWFERNNNVVHEHRGLECLLISLIYITQVQQRTSVLFTKTNIRRFILVAFLLAVKFTQDKEISNAYWAKVGEIPLEELNSLETSLCKTMQFEFFVSEEALANLYTRYIPNVHAIISMLDEKEPIN